MLVYGGYYSENKEVLWDFGLYDLEKQLWVGVSQPWENKHIKLPERYMHTMTIV